MLWVSSEVPRQGALMSIYNIMFCGKIRKISTIIFLIEKVPSGAMSKMFLAIHALFFSSTTAVTCRTCHELLTCTEHLNQSGAELLILG